MKRTYHHMRVDGSHEVVEIVPPNPKALALFVALKEAFEAERALEKAMDEVPSYTGQWSAIDFYGDKEVAFNQAVNRLGEVVGLEEA